MILLIFCTFYATLQSYPFAFHKLIGIGSKAPAYNACLLQQRLNEMQWALSKLKDLHY